jgi:hypothetical protein
MPYLTVEVRHDPLFQAGPYSFFMAWCASESIPHDASWYVEVFDETPVRVTADVIELDENDEWVLNPETGEPVTHQQTFTASALPPLQGTIIR